MRSAVGLSRGVFDLQGGDDVNNHLYWLAAPGRLPGGLVVGGHLGVTRPGSPRHVRVR